MREPLRLLAVLAHPDDESFAVGGTLARYAAEDGVGVHLLTATRGEKGRYYGGERERPSDDEVGRQREEELRRAADVLGLDSLAFLDYVDRELDRADPAEAAGRIAAHLRRIRPQVVVTFDPFGAYGHPDHVAIGQLTTAATVAAAHPDEALDGEPHRVSKLYQAVLDRRRWETMAERMTGMRRRMEDRERGVVPWPDWSVSARVDVGGHWRTAWQALQCHASQVTGYPDLEGLGEEARRAIWSAQPFYRAFSLVEITMETETDLFQGIR